MALSKCVYALNDDKPYEHRDIHDKNGKLIFQKWYWFPKIRLTRGGIIQNESIHGHPPCMNYTDWEPYERDHCTYVVARDFISILLAASVSGTTIHNVIKDFFAIFFTYGASVMACAGTNLTQEGVKTVAAIAKANTKIDFDAVLDVSSPSRLVCVLDALVVEWALMCFDANIEVLEVILAYYERDTKNYEHPTQFDFYLNGKMTWVIPHLSSQLSPENFNYWVNK